MPYFYTKESINGSSTSHGFSNDTVVKVWVSKKARDIYLNTCNNISACGIKRDKVTTYATNYSLTQNCNIKPTPFQGEYWGIETPMDCGCYPDEYPYGYVGTIKIGNQNFEIERFYK